MMKNILIFLATFFFCCSYVFGQVQIGQHVEGDTAGDYFAWSVVLSSDGNRVAVGAPNGHAGEEGTQYIRVYEWMGYDWFQLGQDLIGEDSDDDSGLSISLSSDGNRIAIGAPAHWNDFNDGETRVYEWNGNNWVQLGQDIFAQVGDTNSGNSVSLSSDGNRVAISADYNNLGLGRTRIYDWNGSNWIQIGGVIEFEGLGDQVALSSDGNRIVIGSPFHGGNGSYSGCVRVYEWNGNDWLQLGQDMYGEAAADRLGTTISISENGNRIAAGAPFNDGNGEKAGHARVFEWNGSNWILLGQDIDGEMALDESGSSVSLSADGNRIAIAALHNDGGGDDAGHVRVYEWDGDNWQQFRQDIDCNGSFSSYSGYTLPPVSFASNGERLAIGIPFTAENGAPGYVKVLDLARIPNLITGKIFLDSNSNCMLSNDELGVNRIVVEAISNSATSYRTITDSFGNFNLPVDTGNYVIIANPNSPYIQSCENGYPLYFEDTLLIDTATLDIPMLITADCPYLEVDVSSWALRECFDNNYFVQYCNSGTITAENAYIELSLDDSLFISDAAIPFEGPDMNNIYTFQIGNVEIGDCASFQVNVQLPCDLDNVGQFFDRTFCIDAHIYPDSLCGPLSDDWDGSSIGVFGNCVQDSVQFRIRNIGIGDMQTERQFLVIEDQVVFKQGTFQLESGKDTIISVFANGSTFRIEAEQAIGHPGDSNPSVAVEACGSESQLGLGFVNQFPQDDGDPFVSSECRQVTSSYDPNDKQGFPNGYDDEHYIEANQDIEYLIRFQNTGTDTAFTVVLRDEISEDLDLTTIRAGASSHPYEFEIINRLVKITFNDILLVDSLTNEPESHGFVKFKISQMPDLANGTVIENNVGIYFDYNAPIITNTTYHTIGENFVTVDILDNVYSPLGQQPVAKIYPNPFVDAVNFELDDSYREIDFNLYDVSGRKLIQKHYDNSHFQFQKGDLGAGIYFYKIESEGKFLASGKIILKQ